MPTLIALPPARASRPPRRWLLPLTADPAAEPPSGALTALADDGVVPLVRWSAPVEELTDGQLRCWAAALAGAAAWLAPPAGPGTVAGWRRASDLFLTEGVGVPFVWLPRPPGGAGVPLSAGWPGSAHVDRVGLDLCARRGAPERRAVAAALGALAALAPGLPVVLAGLACRHGEAPPPLCATPRAEVDVVGCLESGLRA